MARFVGGGYLLFSVQAFLGYGYTATHVAAWFNPVATLVVFGPAAALFALSFTHRYDALKWAALITTAGYLVACLLWLIAWDRQAHDDLLVTWLRLMSALPPMALVLIRPMRSALILLACTATIATTLVQLGGLGHVTFTLVPMASWAAWLNCVFVITGALIMQAGKTLDDSLDDAVAAASSSAAAVARTTERARFDALVHDRVIATLIAADRGSDPAGLAVQARSALDELDRLAGDETTGSEALTAAEFVARLRSMVALADPDLAVDVRAMPPAEVTYPSAVTDALVEAVGEAVRNSVRHAGPEAARLVSLEAAPDGVEVLVVDDGVGFEPDKVPGTRLGIAVSIDRRMTDLPGGEAVVHSAPGDGAVVRLRWRR